MRYLILIIMLIIPISTAENTIFLKILIIGGDNYDETKSSSIMGNRFILSGQSQSFNYPTNNSYSGKGDGFISVFEDEELIWSKFIGGNQADIITSVVTSDYIYAGGLTYSENIQIPNLLNSYSGSGDGFITKLDINGKWEWFRYIGTNEYDILIDMVTNENNELIILGTSAGNIFVSKFSSEGDEIWTTNFVINASISPKKIIQKNGNIFIAGYSNATTFEINNGNIIGNVSSKSGFIMSLSILGDINWWRIIGGSENDFIRAIDVNEEVYVTGFTRSSDFANGNYSIREEDIFISVFSLNGEYMWTKIISGGDSDHACGIVAKDTLFIMGGTWSTDFPMINPIQDKNQGMWDGLLIELDLSGEIIFSSYLGGPGYDQFVDININKDIYISGTTDNYILNAKDLSTSKSHNSFYIKINRKTYLTSISFSEFNTLSVSNNNSSVSELTFIGFYFTALVLSIIRIKKIRKK